MNRIQKHCLISALVLILAITLGCGAKTATPAQKSPPVKLKIVASVYPVYEFARQVGGDKIDLTQLVPPGAEPHDWEPTAKEIVAIRAARLFLYHGAGFETIDKLLTPETLGATKAIAVSQGIPALKPEKNDDHGHDNNPSGDMSDKTHDHHTDSHMWLDPLLAQEEVEAIAAALAAADPANADYYRQNAAGYIRELAKLDAEYKAALANLPHREIVTSHAAFGYLAARYGLKQLPIMGLSPDSEPTPEKMASVVKFCREHQVKYIFFETIVSPRLAETIARETGAGLLVLNPVENLTPEEVQQGKNYLGVMRANLANLKKALSQ
ncbi:metal ABC transporter solute-binding protein, Zn/Mn family [Anaeroselena agilis]|uniref:Zinc ABC transporter substrate-binding protein n=1 Tax=Anaeroselena agilis TaxID=3063788 RepID=A0ABU3NX46_9FIRM|nr:zinc ABC transporter substrate-binding protein [Selenomonadales bacterium 4137-cl]